MQRVIARADGQTYTLAMLRMQVSALCQQLLSRPELRWALGIMF
nr:hypothetical protein [Symbiopectobacterium purcellii]